MSHPFDGFDLLAAGLFSRGPSAPRRGRRGIADPHVRPSVCGDDAVDRVGRRAVRQRPQ